MDSVIYRELVNAFLADELDLEAISSLLETLSPWSRTAIRHKNTSTEPFELIVKYFVLRSGSVYEEAPTVFTSLRQIYRNCSPNSTKKDFVDEYIKLRDFDYLVPIKMILYLLRQAYAMPPTQDLDLEIVERKKRIRLLIEAYFLVMSPIGH